MTRLTSHAFIAAALITACAPRDGDVAATTPDGLATAPGVAC